MVLVKVDLVKVDLVKVILVKVDPSDRTTGVDKDPGTGCWGDLLAHQLPAPVLLSVLFEARSQKRVSLKRHHLQFTPIRQQQVIVCQEIRLGTLKENTAPYQWRFRRRLPR